MQNFTAYNPTKIEFGSKAIKKLPNYLQKHEKALVIIGMGSVEKQGILQEVLNELKIAEVDYEIFRGIKPNPEYQKADEAILIAKKIGADCIIAVGGGSVIDTAKAVALGFYLDCSVWEMYLKKTNLPENALPLFAVLTLAATGTEMNPFSVLQDTAAEKKYGFGNPLMYPKVSFLDPCYTFSVSPLYTAYGVADLIAHTLEQFFGIDQSPYSDMLAANILELAFKFGPIAVKEPENFEARANILWLSTVALNGSLNAGKRGGDWGVHGFEHIFSVLFDVPHGAGLSIVYPAWLKYFGNQIAEKLQLLENRLQLKKPFIDYLEEQFEKMGTPTRLSQLQITPKYEEAIINALTNNKVSGMWFKMDSTTYQALLQLMW